MAVATPLTFSTIVLCGLTSVVVWGASEKRPTALAREMSNVREELSWLKGLDGCTIDERLELKIGASEFGDVIPTLQYASYGKEGHRMAYIPESAMFCAGTVEDAKKLLEGQSEGQPHSELLAPNNRATLALLFMHEVYKAKESKWAPLLNNLPRTVHSPLTYTLEELDVINGTFAERKAREFTDYLKSVWYELVEPSMLGNMTAEERFFARGATVDMTFELFKQAVSVTMAYGVTLTHGGVQQAALIPMYHWLRAHPTKPGALSVAHRAEYSTPGLEVLLMRETIRETDKEVFLRNKVGNAGLFADTGIRYANSRAKTGVPVWISTFGSGQVYHLDKDRLNLKLIEFIREDIWRAMQSETGGEDVATDGTEAPPKSKEWSPEVKFLAFESLSQGMRRLFARFGDAPLMDVRRSFPYLPRWQVRAMVEQRDEEKGIVMRTMQLLDNEVRLLQRKFSDAELRPSVAPSAAPTGKPLEADDMKEPVLEPGQEPPLDVKYRYAGRKLEL